MNEDPKIQALAKHFEVDASTVTEERGGYFTVESESGEYAVMTEDEADQAWDESLDSYLDECVLPELPATAQQYFDRDAWKRDARHDGRGHCLSSYDGEEHEEKINGEWFFIYRTN